MRRFKLSCDKSGTGENIHGRRLGGRRSIRYVVGEYHSPSAHSICGAGDGSSPIEIVSAKIRVLELLPH
jgi:hypothetical protein